jgi:hypothetical protein
VGEMTGQYQYWHKNLAAGRWNHFDLIEQLANIGSEIERTITWKKKGNKKYQEHAFERALELLELTIDDPKNRGRLKEILRSREALIDHFVYDNSYKTTDDIWRRYFLQFTYAAQQKRLTDKANS